MLRLCWLVSQGRSFVFTERSKGKHEGVEQGLACPHARTLQATHGMCEEGVPGSSIGRPIGRPCCGPEGRPGAWILVLAVKESGRMPEAKSLGWVHTPASSNPVQLSCEAHVLRR